MGHGGGHVRSILIGGVLLLLTLSVPAGTAAAPVFEEGDLVVGTTTGLQWLHSDGSHAATLEDAFPVPHQNAPTSFYWKAAFDPSGRLWVTPGECCGENKAVVYDQSGQLLGPIVDPFDPECGEPTDIAFDAKGNAYIGDWGSCDGRPRFGAKKFDSDGNFLKVLVGRESDGIDLAADQCTLFWQDANGEHVYRRNVCVDASPIEGVYGPCTGDESVGMRILPDGSILSVEQGLPYIVRVDSEAKPELNPCPGELQTYDAPDCDRWFGVQLSEDGDSFWATCFRGWTPIDPGTPIPYEFNVASGEVLRTLATHGVVRAVFGGFRAAQDRTPSPVPQVSGHGRFNTEGNGQVVFTISNDEVSFDRIRGQRFSFTGEVESVIGEEKSATLTGTGTWNGQSGYAFEVSVVDKGGWGRLEDLIDVVIRSPAGTTIFTSFGAQVLKQGDISVTPGEAG
jgi:hypothetical protein